MVWSDRSLVTHQYAAGTGSGGEGFGGPDAAVDMGFRKATTMGIATVEHPEIIAGLLNVSPDDIRASGWLNPQAILQRFGARPKFDAMEASTSATSEFWYALFKFQENWANQFSAQVPITFMPELFPGMLLRLVDYGVQFYVDGVNHSWSMASTGGGFETTAHVGAPSSLDGGLLAMVKGA
jgi:hypothetical protein